MIINLTYKEVHNIVQRLEEVPMEKAKEFLLAMPRANIILDLLDIAMLGFDPYELYKKMTIIYKDNPKALNLIKETVEGNVYYREK